MITAFGVAAVWTAIKLTWERRIRRQKLENRVPLPDEGLYVQFSRSLHLRSTKAELIAALRELGETLHLDYRRLRPADAIASFDELRAISALDSLDLEDLEALMQRYQRKTGHRGRCVTIADCVEGILEGGQGKGKYRHETGTGAESER